MANTNPTVIAAHLSDTEMKTAIDALVAHVDKGAKQMSQSMTNAVEQMKKQLQSLGNINVDAGGASDGGSKRRTKRQNEETQAIRQTTIAYDSLAQAQQKATGAQTFRNAETIQTMNIQLDLMRERLREARQQFSSFVALASHASTTGDKGLFTFATENVHRYEAEVKNLIPQIRNLQNSMAQMQGVIAPQGHTIQNYINSLLNANPQLAALNAQYKSGTSLLQQYGGAQMQVAQALHNQSAATADAAQKQEQFNRKIQRQAEILRQDMMQRGSNSALWGSAVIYGDEKKYGTIEQQLVNAHREALAATERRIAAEQREQQIKQETVNTTQQQLQVERSITDEQSKRAYKAPQTTINQSFANMQANALGMSREYLAGYTTDINTMTKRLQQLNQTWNALTSHQRTSPFGLQLREEIQTTTRELEKLRNQASRPINLQSALGLSAKTLDEIAYKVRMLQSYRGTLNITDPRQKQEIEQINQALTQLQKKQREFMNSNKGMIESNAAVSRSLDYMKNRLAFMFTVGASTSFVKELINIRSQYELLERSIGILFDSMQTGTKIFSELNAMAIKSPFTTMELGAAAKQLSAYDIAAKDVVDTTRRLADMAAAVGIPIERLTYALGQVKAYGYLNARDARMFANAGIPLIANLADMYTKLEGRLVSVGDVYDRIKKKQISFEDTLKVVYDMTDKGGRFFNFQEKAADTLKVKLANLTLAYNNFLNQAGKSNQGIVTTFIGTLKVLLENWRKIENLVLSLATILGVVKTVQLLILLNTKGITKQMALQEVLGKKLGSMIFGIAKNLKMLALNPMTWIGAAVTAVGYLAWQWWDLHKATVAFNKDLANNAKENLDSIDKFFNQYRKDIESISSMSNADQQKMWERIAEEIEKTSKNAQQYIQILEKVPDTAARVQKGYQVLQEVQNIQREVSRLADKGYLSLGGGFADDSLATDLRDYEKQMNALIVKFGDLEKAREHFGGRRHSGDLWVTNAWGRYVDALEEVQTELDKLPKSLEKANLDKIFGSGTAEEQIARLRDFSNAIRDNILATEEGQNVSTEGQALLNAKLDEWIAKKSVERGILDANTAQIEANRTAWEDFFNKLEEEDKKTIDYLIKTNQTGSIEFQNIWDKAADELRRTSVTSYNLIQEHIAKLRSTPDIVINVVYRETRQTLDAQQEYLENTYIRPKGWMARGLSAEQYKKEETANRTKYGRLMRKQDEDNVEWEKRLGDEYQANEKAINSLNHQLAEYDKLSKEQQKNANASIQQKVKEREQYKGINEAIKEVASNERLRLEDEKKNKKTGGKTGKKEEDVVAEALKQEISLINEMRSNYEKLRKAGVRNIDAINLASRGYEATILRINNVLQKFGIDKFNASDFAGKNVKQLLDSLTKQRDALLASGKVKTTSLKEMDVLIQKLTIDAKTYDLKKITDGLNNELGKLKDEYELAVELDANPELGNMFAEMFGLDVESLPHSFQEAYQKANNIAKTELKKLGADIKDFDLMSAKLVGDANNQWQGYSMDSEFVQTLQKNQKAWQDMFKKNMLETEKMLDDYVKKYGDYSDRIAEIEKDRLTKIRLLNEAYFTEEMQKSPEYKAKLTAINAGAQKEQQKVDFDAFKESRFYTAMFENLDYVSTSVIRDMRDKLRELMDTMHNLSPDQLKHIMTQYEKLQQKLSKRSPFKTLAKDFKEYVKTTKNRKAANQAFADADKEYSKQQKVVAELKKRREQIKQGQGDNEITLEQVNEEITAQERVLAILKEQLDAAQEKADKYNLIKKLALEELTQTAQLIATNLKSLGALRDNLQETFGVDFGENINGFVDGLAKVGDGVSGVVQSAQSGDIFGVVNGVVDVFAGIGDGIASLFGDGAARTKRLQREIEASEEAVRQLNMAYKELERTVDRAMGAEELRARRSEIANKKAELSEIQRQMQLEQAKRSKDRDDDKIKQYQERIQDLQFEIQDLASSITETLLGSDVKSAAEDFVSTWVSAWRSGEDMMDAIGGKFDDMIDNMIAKSIASYLVSKRIQKIWDAVDEVTGESSEGGAEITMNELRRLKQLIGNKTISEAINEDLTKLYEALGIAYGSGAEKDKNLSALQQGITGITEDTAGAIEAYMNIVAQRVFEHGIILTEIRDAVISFDMDVQLGTMSQILLQLQASYQTQAAIQTILEGVLTPSGRAFMVEMN